MTKDRLEQTVILHLIKVAHIRELLARGDRGDMQARRLVYMIKGWCDNMRDQGQNPGCVSCQKPLDGEVGAWGLLTPRQDEPMVGSDHIGGLAGAFCIACAQQHDTEELLDRFVSNARHDLQMGFSTMH